jgi:DNA-binding transcriptional LysR family regulator
VENNLKYFLVVAEELNISKAAKRLFITQQSLSMHIKRLEKTYNTTLLNRKPRISLTPAGEMLARTLDEIRLLEEGLSSRINTMSHDFRGRLNIGISHSRANIVMPHIIPAYKRTYPNIDIFLHYNNTVENLENRLMRGYLDLFIGVSQINNDSIGIIPLHDENLYVIISRNLLKKSAFPHSPPNVFRSTNKANMLYFENIPFILNTEDELSYKIYTRYFESNDIRLHSIFSCNDSYLRTFMCTQDLGASIVVELMLRHARRHNSIQGQHNPLYYFPLEELKISCILAYHKKMFLTEYARNFISLVSETMSKFYENDGN